MNLTLKTTAYIDAILKKSVTANIMKFITPSRKGTLAVMRCE